MDPSQIWDFIQQSYYDADKAAGYDVDNTQGGAVACRPRRVVLPKDYVLTFTTIAAGATISLPLYFQANGDFVLVRARFTPTITSAGGYTASTIPIPELRIQITDSGTDEQYCNQPTDINSFATHSGLANGAPDRVYPRLITGASTLNVAITSYEPSEAVTLDLVLQGVLVKTFGA